MKLRSEGAIKAFLAFVRCGHQDVLSQVARGIANFAKCESRASSRGEFYVSKLVIALVINTPVVLLGSKSHIAYLIVSGMVKKSDRSFLIEDGALPWIVQNANNEAAAIKCHMELALCHLAQHDDTDPLLPQLQNSSECHMLGVRDEEK
ncbi:hypothetical protein Lal_00021213 [Lupinus albus]|nr:hypothetical protein Lal_00021213 [Lupinus albus]